MKADEQQIRDVIARWAAATKAGDLDTIVTLMIDDALFLTPGNAPMTKDGFVKSFRGFAGNISIESNHDIAEIHVSGDLACCPSHITVVRAVAALSRRQPDRRDGGLMHAAHTEST